MGPGASNERALSFGAVAASYDRGRPGYPPEAATWLAGTTPRRVLELGAGTGKLTGGLLALGHDLLATDPLAQMLAPLRTRHPACSCVVARAEALPVASRSVDVVVAAQAFHWFDPVRALPEIARVLRPGGTIALAWNTRDERIPWVRRLGRLLEPAPDSAPHSAGLNEHPTQTLVSSGLFGFVEEQSFRFWQPLDRSGLRDLVRSRSAVATQSPDARDGVLTAVDALYDDYAAGPEGLRLPYVTRCFRAAVRPFLLDETESAAGTVSAAADDGALLFRLG